MRFFRIGGLGILLVGLSWTLSGCLAIGLWSGDTGKDREIADVEVVSCHATPDLLRVNVKVVLKRYFWGWDEFRWLELEEATPEVAISLEGRPEHPNDSNVFLGWMSDRTGRWREKCSVRVVRVTPRRNDANDRIREAGHSAGWPERQPAWLLIEAPADFPTFEAGVLPEPFLIDRTLYVPFEWSGRKFYCYEINFWLSDNALREQFAGRHWLETTARVVCTPVALTLDLAGIAISAPLLVPGMAVGHLFCSLCSGSEMNIWQAEEPAE